MTGRPKRKPPIGQSIGGVLFGFEQQVFRNIPPPHELVHRARPDNPVPAGDGGLVTIELPGDPAAGPVLASGPMPTDPTDAVRRSPPARFPRGPPAAAGRGRVGRSLRHSGSSRRSPAPSAGPGADRRPGRPAERREPRLAVHPPGRRRRPRRAPGELDGRLQERVRDRARGGRPRARGHPRGLVTGRPVARPAGGPRGAGVPSGARRVRALRRPVRRG